jgi:hypothetical protein
MHACAVPGVSSNHTRNAFKEGYPNRHCYVNLRKLSLVVAGAICLFKVHLARLSESHSILAGGKYWTGCNVEGKCWGHCLEKIGKTNGNSQSWHSTTLPVEIRFKLAHPDDIPLKGEPDRDYHAFCALLTRNRQVYLSMHSSGFLRLQLGKRWSCPCA